jgi:hypothetical protein
MIVSGAPAPCLQVILEVGVPTRNTGHRVERRVRERGAAEVGMQNHTGSVDDRSQ